MISKYINDWLEIIENMHNDNTYKLAWSRAILECIHNNNYIEDRKAYISIDEISKCMLKYYWNQLFFFNLKQSSNDKKPPIICQLTNSLIEEYKKITNSIIPVWYDKGIEEIKKNPNFYNKIIKQTSKVLPNDVSWRFKMINGNTLPIYEYDYKNKDEFVIFEIDSINELKDYSIILTKLINYKWSQLLEKFNYAPKIANKVNGISNEKLRRNSLNKYKEELLKEYNGKAIDFYTGEEINKKDISIDHVIPWSYMYSDDIWNLVITTKSYNSSKSNIIPNSKIIEKLKKRNDNLVNYVSKPYKDELLEACSRNYVDKFYYECRL